jgi:drug/metabolite transporter (DMT)-like permease
MAWWIWLIIGAAVCGGFGLLFQKKATPSWFWMSFFVLGAALLFIVFMMGLEILIGPIPGLHRNR